MEIRLSHLLTLMACPILFCLPLHGSHAFHEQKDSVSQRMTYGPNHSHLQPVSPPLRSASQEKTTSQLLTTSRALLSSKYGAGSVEMNPTTGVVRRLRGIPIAKGLKNTSTLSDKESSLRQFVDENPDLLGVKSSHLTLLSQTEKGGRSYFAYQQKVDGLPLYGAFLKATLDSQGNLSVLTSSCWPEVEYSAATTLTAEETAVLSAQRIVNRKELDEIPRYQLKSSEKVLFPLSTPGGTLFQISYRQVIHLEDPLGDWVTVVDTNSGVEYVRYNNYRFATTHGTVQGKILPAYYNDTPQIVPFENEYVHSLSQTPAYAWDLNSDPGWTKEGLWAYGVPNGYGGNGYYEYDRGPTAGHTGTNVLGYNLKGGYINDMTATQYLTTQAFDCSALSGTHLSFWRWLGIESADYDHASLQVSSNGTDWVTVWSNYETRTCHEWECCIYDISAIADGKSTVYIRWGMGPTDEYYTYSGWYVDDISILAGGETTITSATGDFSVQTPATGTPVLHSELKGPFADVVYQDGPRLQYNHTSPSDPAGWTWTIPELTVVQSWNLDTSPGWNLNRFWEWGIPLGAEGDPSQAHTGQNVLGNNLSGTYENLIRWNWTLTTSEIDCSGYTETHLRFWRWLGIEASEYDSVGIQVRNDNNSLPHNVYQNPSIDIQDTSWRQVTYDISYVADGQSTVTIQWGLGPTDYSEAFSGWNIDDIELLTAPTDPDFTVGLYDLDESNIFYHMGVARKSIKAIDPSFTGVDYSMPAVARRDIEAADSYYDGWGLSFGEGDGTTCRNLAHFADNIYHEFAHAVTHNIYPDDLLPDSGQTGAMDEAWSDYFACTITNEPMIGEGGMLIGSPWLRNMDNNLSVPEDLHLDVYRNSGIFGAGLWSLRVLLGKDLADHLIHFARFNLAGSFLDYYEDLLITDDTDSNLQNGTPHMLEIAKAFGPHGIGGLRVDSISQTVSTEVYANGKLDAGETGTLLPQVTSHFVAGNVQLSAQTANPYLSISDGNVSYGDMEYSSTVTKIEDTVGVSISPTCPEDEILPVTFTLTAAGGYSSTEIHHLINAPSQILYDEGESQWYWGYGGKGGGFAVRFTPPKYPVTLTTLRLMPEEPSDGEYPVPIQVKVWDDDGAGGGPGTELTPSKEVQVPFTGTWYEVPLVFDRVEPVYTWDMESDPGWTAESDWQRGTPTSSVWYMGPNSAYSGTNVYGYTLGGVYQNNMTAQYLTTTPIDCSALEKTTLEFQRWLGVEGEPNDHATLEISNDGTTWTTIWENGTTNFIDDEWTQESFDISSIADGKKTVYVRWGMGPTNDDIVSFGWRIDDVVIGVGTVINGINVNKGDVFVGWQEMDTTYYNGVTLKCPDNRSWMYDVDLGKWFPLMSTGYPMDMMARVRYTTATGISSWIVY